jgi:hypothetical protein
MEGTMADVPERIWLEPGPYGWRLGGPGGARGFESEPYVTLAKAEVMAAEARREALPAEGTPEWDAMVERAFNAWWLSHDTSHIARMHIALRAALREPEA